jgi:hypothetical protein
VLRVIEGMGVRRDGCRVGEDIGGMGVWVVRGGETWCGVWFDMEFLGF